MKIRTEARLAGRNLGSDMSGYVIRAGDNLLGKLFVRQNSDEDRLKITAGCDLEVIGRNVWPMWPGCAEMVIVEPAPPLSEVSGANIVGMGHTFHSAPRNRTTTTA